MAITNKTMWEDYIVEEIPHKSTLISSGVAQMDTNPVYKDGETTHRIPGLDNLEDIAGDDEVITAVDGMELTPVDADGFEEFGPILHRGKSIRDKYTNQRDRGLEILETYAPQIGAYQGNQTEKRFVNVLEGLFANTGGILKDSHRTDARTENLELDHVTNAKAQHSTVNEEAGQLLKVGFWNPLVHADAANRGAVTYVSAGELGAEIFKNGQMPVMGGVAFIENARVCTARTIGDDTFYPTYLFGPDALYFGLQKDMEIDEGEILLKNGKQWILQWLLSFSIGVRGVSWDSTTKNPTNAQLATANKWTKARPDHQIRVRQIITKIGPDA